MKKALNLATKALMKLQPKEANKPPTKIAVTSHQTLAQMKKSKESPKSDNE